MNLDTVFDTLFDAAIAGDADAKIKLSMQTSKHSESGETILHIESKRGNTEYVKFILREFPNANLLVKLTTYNYTALHWAAYAGHTEVVEVLIEAARHLPNDDTLDNPVTSFQAFLRHMDYCMHTALHIAVECGYVDIVKLLVEADPTERRPGDKNMDTALHAAVARGHVDIVKLLVEADPTDPHIQNNEGKTPMYTAVEDKHVDIVEIICTTCTAPTLDGPGGTTALHAAISNIDKANKINEDVIRMIINAAKRWSTPQAEDLFNKTDESGCTVLELAVMGNHVDMVDLILVEDPAYQPGHPSKKYAGLMSLICKAIDWEYEDIVELLSRTYEIGGYKGAVAMIRAIKKRDTDSVLRLLKDAKHLATFVYDKGWTPLHYATFHELDLVLDAIIEAQKDLGCKFINEDMVETPLLVAAAEGYTSTVIRLMELWPTSSSEAYTAINSDDRNILHLAAAKNKKEMIQGILKYCPEKYKDKILQQQDVDGNTPLHLLISHGCFIPELIKHRGLDTMVRNKRNWTPRDMLYFTDDIIADQVKFKIALDHIQIDKKKNIFSSSVLSISKREEKDVIFKKQANQMIHQMLARMKEDTRAVANCFADAIAGDPISKAALEMEADTLQEEGKTILHVESMRGVTERVEYILREFAIKNLLVKLDISKQTALHLAAHHGHTRVVEALIEAARHLPSSSANDDTHNPIRSFQDFIRQTNGQMGNTALHLAVLNRNVAIVKLLVQADPNDNHVQNNEGKTPMYIAAEKGYKDIVKEICMTCTALSVDGPGGRTTALHALVQNAGQEASDMIRMIFQAAKRCSADYEALFCRTDELGNTVLQLAVERNYVNAVELILQEDLAYQHGGEIKRNGLMRLIYKAIDDENCSDDITKLLSKAYLAGIDPDHKDVLDLILAMKRRDEDSVLRLLGDAKGLVNFKEDNGWTPLHYAVYHEFDSILGDIIEAQENGGHQFVYGDLVSTPFHVAIEHGYSSTLVRLMQLWPALSSASIADKSPYTVVNKDGQNILHLAASIAADKSPNTVVNKDGQNILHLVAADNKKEMVKEMIQGILKYCPGMCKDKILKQQDNNGNTPLHLLISQGCFIPELINDEGRDTMAKNKNGFTPWEMLYSKNDVVADQVEIIIAIDDVCAKSTEKKTDIWKSIPQSKRRIKDVMFDEQRKKLMDAKNEQRKEQRKKDLERYKMRTNTQIIVTALITTVTFTVGFTMPGGLRQSGEVDEGLALLSKKTAFNAFMVSDALALLLSTSSLFFYFLESMNEDPRQVRKLNDASTVLNIVSVVAMMLTFIAGTYLVLSHSPALAITVCIIGSLFFLLIIFMLIKIVYDRLYVKKGLD